MRMRYLYRCTTDKLLHHIARIEESGDRVLSEHFVGSRDWNLICEKGQPGLTLRGGTIAPARVQITGYVLDVLKAHTWWNDRNACECGAKPTDHADPVWANTHPTDWHAEHVAGALDGKL